MRLKLSERRVLAVAEQHFGEELQPDREFGRFIGGDDTARGYFFDDVEQVVVIDDVGVDPAAGGRA